MITNRDVTKIWSVAYVLCLIGFGVAFDRHDINIMLITALVALLSNFIIRRASK